MEAEAGRQRLEEELQHRYGMMFVTQPVIKQSDTLIDAPSLNLRSSGRHGVHVYIGKSKRDLSKIEGSPHFIPIASTASSKCYFNQACETHN